jgi:urea carboxylase-associated protein 2
MGRILASITEDTCGWHDPLAGHMDAAQTTAKYGEARYQQHRNDFHRNSRENFLIELEKYGLTIRDLPHNVNFFSRVIAAEDGALQYVEANSKAGDYVELRAEMNTLVVLDTCQHPLDPAASYHPRSVKLEIFKVPPAAADDRCRLSRPENERGFINTQRYFL